VAAAGPPAVARLRNSPSERARIRGNTTVIEYIPDPPMVISISEIPKRHQA